MRVLGIILIAIGTVWFLIAFNMDTSVATGGGMFLPDRVENIGLIAQRQNHLYGAGLVTLIGVLLAIFGKGSDQTSHSGVEAKKGSSQPPLEKDLSSDAYKLWLAEKYNIQRNDVFGRFVVNNHMFDTLDEALKFAHETDKNKGIILSNYEETDPIEMKRDDSAPLIALAIAGMLAIAALTTYSR